MELHRGHRTLDDPRREPVAVLAPSAHADIGRRMDGVGVIEVEPARAFVLRSGRARCAFVLRSGRARARPAHGVPAHVGNGYARRQTRHTAPQHSETRPRAALLAALEQNLHAQTDTEVRALGTYPVAHEGSQTGGLQALHAAT